MFACLPDCVHPVMSTTAREPDACLITLTGVGTPLHARSFKPFGASLHENPRPSKRTPYPPKTQTGAGYETQRPLRYRKNKRTFFALKVNAVRIFASASGKTYVQTSKAQPPASYRPSAR